MALIQTHRDPIQTWSTVDTRYRAHGGSIVDLGCLYWDWSQHFIQEGFHVVGADPQEREIPGAILFKGVVGATDGNCQIEAAGAVAKVGTAGEWYPQMSWKTFCKAYNIDRVAILKINIEGGEYPLLNSMDAEDFSKIDQITVSFHEWLWPEQRAQAEATRRLLELNGFNLMKIDTPYGWWLATKAS